MRKQYDFAKSVANPYLRKTKKQQVTIRLDEETVKYFKAMAEATAIPYQNLINLYLRECAVDKRKLRLVWDSDK